MKLSPIAKRQKTVLWVLIIFSMSNNLEEMHFLKTMVTIQLQKREGLIYFTKVPFKQKKTQIVITLKIFNLKYNSTSICFAFRNA